MMSFKFKNVCIEATAVNLPTIELSSAEIEDRIAPLYQRLEIPFGTLEKLSGVKTRYLWPREVMPSQVGTQAARNAIEQCGMDPKDLKFIVNCSVTRDFFEPATACLIHRNLGLSEDCMAMDISNACIGFSNGLLMLASLIEAGTVKAGIVTSGETITPIIESSIGLLRDNQTIRRDELLKVLPTFTLGCGSAAFILTHESISKSKHRLLGSVGRSATEHCDLCNGNADYQIFNNQTVNPLMYTESAKLMASASKLGGRMFKDFTEAFGWKREDVDRVFCHQVGKQVNEAFYAEMGLDIQKEYTMYKKYGNLVSAALPSALTLGVTESPPPRGTKILLTAFGSGLNSIFTGIEW